MRLGGGAGMGMGMGVGGGGGGGDGGDDDWRTAEPVRGTCPDMCPGQQCRER